MFMHLKMKAEDIKFVFISVALVFSLACCISITKAAVSGTIDTGNQEKEVIVERIEEPSHSAEDKDCDKAIESIQEQSANIDEGMAEIKRDLEELKKRKKKKKITKKKIKTKKVIDK
jgi:molecular chaperone GrpE (heat shock protein)